jgi:hypothetical protein
MGGGELPEFIVARRRKTTENSRPSNSLIIDESYNMSWVLYLDPRTLAVGVTEKS